MPEFGLPSATPGGPVVVPPTLEPTASDWMVRTPSAVPAGTEVPFRTYAVVLVAEGGVLEAHTAAGNANPIAGSVAWDALDLHATGNTASIGSESWVEITLPGGGTGWVDRKFLTEDVSSADFCAEPRVPDLFTQLKEALRTNDGRLLSPLVSPIHGLTVVYIHNGNFKIYDPAQVGDVFGSPQVVDWGLGPGSGLAVQGTFEDLVRPDLLAVFGAAYEFHCNAIALGGASYVVTWPALWKNINFYSVFKPGAPGTEMDWMTWLTGVEYVDGAPYLFSLSRYNWEP
jgi:hypothetical protein